MPGLRSSKYVQISAILAICFSLVVGDTRALLAENWPGYRGPTGMGISSETELPLEWSADGTNVLWKTPLPATVGKTEADHNQSSPIAWGDRVFVTTALWPGSDKSDVPQQHVTCYQTVDGAQVWDAQVPA